MQPTKQSEVARLVSQINAEYEAAQQGLSGLAYGTSQHDFINARMERMSNCVSELKKKVGEDVLRQCLNDMGK